MIQLNPEQQEVVDHHASDRRCRLRTKAAIFDQYSERYLGVIRRRKGNEQSMVMQFLLQSAGSVVGAFQAEKLRRACLAARNVFRTGKSAGARSFLIDANHRLLDYFYVLGLPGECAQWFRLDQDLFARLGIRNVPDEVRSVEHAVVGYDRDCLR